MNDPADLGFRHRLRKSGELEILHHGRLASTLRGPAAQACLAELQGADLHGAQQLMARITGNYKRGNERAARGHPRNRG